MTERITSEAARGVAAAALAAPTPTAGTTAVAAAAAYAVVRADEEARDEPTLAGPEPLIDVHAHFYHPDAPRGDWAAVNAARLRAGERIGISWHVASVLGSWGATSPTYFASPDDLTRGNDVQLALQAALPERVRSYVHVNPNFPEHALAEIDRAVAGGAIGVKLSASRRADDPLLDAIASEAGARGLPILHHVWQWRRRDWPMQEASDGVELGRLAARHPRTIFILAHVGGGGDYQHTYAAVTDVPNVLMDLSGSGVDRGMLDAAVAAVGPRRLLWACDVTIETGLAKLRALDHVGLDAEGLADIRWRNAVRIFPPGAFGSALSARAAALDARGDATPAGARA
jgi:predicted TIM-barrel fold metal-dependent hydrolase